MFLIVSSITKLMSYRHHNFDKFYYKMIKRFFPKQEKFQNARTSLTQNSRMSPIRNPHVKNPTLKIHPQKKRRVSHARRPSHMTYTPRNKRTSKCDVHNKPWQLEALLAITHKCSKKKTTRKTFPVVRQWRQCEQTTAFEAVSHRTIST